MTEALKTHIAMFPELPEGFAWEVGEPEWRYGGKKADPAFAGLILVASFVYTIGCNLTPDRDRYYSGNTNNKGAEND